MERRVAPRLCRPDQSSLQELKALLEKVDVTALFSLEYIGTVLGTGEISHNTVLEILPLTGLCRCVKITRDRLGGASVYCM